MKKTNETKQNIAKTQADVTTVETVELENVTGGCAACGCGRPAAGGSLQFGARFRRF